MATATLTKWGNSQGLIIPKSICEKIGLRIGDKLDIEANEDTIELKAQRKRFARTKHYTIDELFEGYSGEYKPPSDWPTFGNEVSWGSPAGKEVW